MSETSISIVESLNVMGSSSSGSCIYIPDATVYCGASLGHQLFSGFSTPERIEFRMTISLGDNTQVSKPPIIQLPGSFFSLFTASKEKETLGLGRFSVTDDLTSALALFSMNEEHLALVLRIMLFIPLGPIIGRRMYAPKKRPNKLWDSQGNI